MHAVDPRAGSAARATNAVRRATAALLTTHEDRVGLAAIAARIHAVADSLELRADTVAGRIQQMDKIGRIMRYSPAVGSLNAIAPPLRLHPFEGGLEGTVCFSAAYQGANAMVHEGAVALVLDVALAEANIQAGAVGVTAQLTLRFHRPIPVGCELHVTSRHDSMNGRKIFSSGQLWMDKELCVSAEGLFIAVPQEVRDAPRQPE
jgi:acyl-CoA thioesterase FadM